MPVRVGVPPSNGAAAAAARSDRAGGRAGDVPRAEDLPCCTVSRMPAIVSTFPFSPFGSFGVSFGSATYWPLVDVS